MFPDHLTIPTIIVAFEGADRPKRPSLIWWSELSSKTEFVVVTWQPDRHTNRRSGVLPGYKRSFSHMAEACAYKFSRQLYFKVWMLNFFRTKFRSPDQSPQCVAV